MSQNPIERRLQPPVKEGAKRLFEEISTKFRYFKKPFTKERVQKEIIEKYNRDDILEAVDDSNHGQLKPDLLFLILDILDPKAVSKTLVAPWVIESSESDPEIKKMAQACIDARISK